MKHIPLVLDLQNVGEAIGPFHRESRIIIQRLNSFYLTNPDWDNINSPASLSNLVFPSVMPVPRIPLNANGEYSYLGRGRTTHLIQALLPLQFGHKKIILGNMGSGKSHIITTAILQLRAELNTRVIFVADCKAASVAFEHLLLSALEIEFPNEFNSAAYNLTPKLQRDYIRRFILTASSLFRIFFVYDGWEFYESATSAITCQQQFFLQGLSFFGIEVRVISTTRPACFNFRADQSYLVFGGLTQVEWNGWRKHPPYNVLNNPQDYERLEHVTAFIPLLLRTLASYIDVVVVVGGGGGGPQNGNGSSREGKGRGGGSHSGREGEGEEVTQTVAFTLTERLNRYNDDPEMRDYGGLWVKEELTQHLNKIFSKNDHESKTYLDIMIAALTKHPCGRFYGYLIDHRFFYLENRTIIPVCGYVKEIMAKIIEIRETTKFSYFQECETKEWIIDAYSRTANSAIRDFYFKRFVIAKIIMDLHRQNENSWNGISFIHFEDAFPHQKDLNLNPGETNVYLSSEFNQRYIDMVIRAVPPLKKKRKAVENMKLEVIRITTQSPLDQATSLDFFVTLHNEYGRNITDFERYELNDDPDKFVIFRWEVPANVIVAAQMPPPPPPGLEAWLQQTINRHTVPGIY